MHPTNCRYSFEMAHYFPIPERERLVKRISGVLYEGRVKSMAARLFRLGGPRACRVKERALTHKYRVGETVYFTASNVSRPASSGTYQVIRLLPTDGDDCQYRIKSSDEAFERVAKESQLSAS
jgi:hypothetical protein